MNAFTTRAGLAKRLLFTTLASSLLALGLASVPTAAQAADPVPPPGGLPQTVSADPLPTWQLTGVVWSQVVVGNTVYATGSFTKARPAGMWAGGPTEINVSNIFAYDIRTGARVTSFNHSLNAQGLSIVASPDGSTLYVGGDFTAVDGQVRQHVAAFNTATGALVKDFAPVINGQVKAVTATSDTVFVGGSFESAAGKVRRRLASFTASTGQLNSWAPTADDGYVWSMTTTPDKTKVIIGGQFSTLNGLAVYGMGAVDRVTGASLPWKANSVIKDSGGGSIDALKSDGKYVYGAGYAYGSGGKFEGTFSLDPADGSIRWMNDCQGDSYDVHPAGDVVYTVSHSHNCTMLNAFPDTSPRKRWQHAGAYTNAATGTNNGPDVYGWNYKGQPAPTMLHYYPDLGIGTATGQYQAAWSVTGNSSFVVMGGEFPTVNAKPQQGLTRYAVKPSAPNKVGPQYLGTAPVRTAIPTTSAVSVAPGSIRVSFGAAWDQDDSDLTYRVYRDKGTAAEKLVKTIALKSNFWTLPNQLVTDTGVPAGSHKYQISITDPSGNELLSPVSDPVSATQTTSPYAVQVAHDGASHLWRLGENNTLTYDSVGDADGTAGSGVTRGVSGAIANDTDRASSFNGTTSGSIGMGTATSYAPAPNTFTAEGWFKTSSTTGGKILGYGSSLNGSSGGYDRHVYLNNAGKVTFGVNPGPQKTITSPTAYNDGRWHMFTASLDVGGMSLYLDGQLIGRDVSATKGLSFSGWWRIGGDSLGSWPNIGSSGFFNGSIDDVAIYPTVLTSTQINEHFRLSGRTPTGAAANASPTAAFTSTTSALAAAFDGSTSSDPDGTIASYAWTFGDGATGTGVKPSHTYTTAGSYPVKLTVTDNAGATDAKTGTVTVAAANVKPTAAFAATTSDLVASFDASDSTDTDGTIASYGWDFGDGSAAGSGKTPDHSYSAAGSYTVKLTVTDNAGATDTLSKTVTVTVTGVIAKDGFARTSATGWGKADVGGTWTYSGSTSLFAVANSAGTMKMAAPGSGPTAKLGVLSTNTDLQFDFSFDKAATGGGQFVRAIARGTQADGYAARVWVKSNNTMVLYLTRIVNGSETDVASKVLTSSFVPNTSYTVRVQASGSGTTELRAKTWAAAASEPTAWSATATDSTASLQDAGGIAVRAYLSGSATSAPVQLAISNLNARPTGN